MLKKRISHPRRSVRRSRIRRSVSKKRISHPRRSVKRSRKIYDGGVSCPTCTFINPDHLEICEVCGNQLAEEKKATEDAIKKVKEAIEKEKEKEEKEKEEKEILDAIKRFEEEENVRQYALKSVEEVIKRENLKLPTVRGEERKNLKLATIRGDGFCSLYAIMLSYLCIPGKKLLVNNKGEYIENIGQFIEFLNDYIDTLIKKNKKELKHNEERSDYILLENDELKNLKEQINNKNTGTIVTQILWTILPNIFMCNIEIYEKNIMKNKVTNKQITTYKYNEEKCVVRIYTNLAHYYSIIDAKLNIDNISKYAKIWIHNMININYTGDVERYTAFKETYKFDAEDEIFDISEYRRVLDSGKKARIKI